MARWHLFEIEDQPWCPVTLRNAMTAYIHHAVRVTGHVKYLAPKLLEALRQNGSTHVLDLASGSGGLIADVADALSKSGIPVRVTATDLYPNLETFRALPARLRDRVDYLAESVSAKAVPSELDGMRTLFNAFHHFRPADAFAIVEDAVKNKRGIAVFEIVERNLVNLIGMVLAPVFLFFLMPFVRPVKLSWLFLTYVIPILPLAVFWDGFVSCLRVYSPEELRELVKPLAGSGYRWEIGKVRLGQTPGCATYLIGLPNRAR